MASTVHSRANIPDSTSYEKWKTQMYLINSSTSGRSHIIRVAKVAVHSHFAMSKLVVANPNSISTLDARGDTNQLKDDSQWQIHVSNDDASEPLIAPSSIESNIPHLNGFHHAIISPTCRVSRLAVQPQTPYWH